MTAVEPVTAAGWWVYGVVEPGARPPRGPGVGGAVETLEAGEIAALVGRVDLTEFGEEPVREHLEDAAWLERNARAHESVLEEALAAGGAVVPFRFLTVYAEEAELRRFLASHERDLRAVLERVRGTVELGVKAFVDRTALERSIAARSPAVAELDESIAEASSGRAYLLGRRRGQLARDEAAQVLAGVVADAHERLSRTAIDAVVNAVQPAELSGRAEQMLLNGAYLVRRDAEQLTRLVEELGQETRELGVTFELTGPWPPYNFVPRDLGTP